MESLERVIQMAIWRIGDEEGNVLYMYFFVNVI